MKLCYLKRLRCSNMIYSCSCSFVVFVVKLLLCTDRKVVGGPADEECLTSVSSSSRRVASSRSKRIRSFTMNGRGRKYRRPTPTQSHTVMRWEVKLERGGRSVRGGEEGNTAVDMWYGDDWMILYHTKHTKGKGEMRKKQKGMKG